MFCGFTNTGKIEDSSLEKNPLIYNMAIFRHKTETHVIALSMRKQISSYGLCNDSRRGL